jgi:hypothetical protein
VFELRSYSDSLKSAITHNLLKVYLWYSRPDKGNLELIIIITLSCLKEAVSKERLLLT